MKVNLGLQLSQRALLSPELESFVEPSTDTRLSYAELNAYSNRCAGVLAACGLRKGDRLALLLHNCAEFVALYYGAAKLGIVVVPLNTRLTAAELTFILSDSGAKALLYSDSFDELVAGIKASNDYPLDIDTWIAFGAAPTGDAALTELLTKASSAEPKIRSGGDDNLLIMYTSGTTGLPKGVVHSHQTISWAALGWATTMDTRYQDRMLMPLPLFHVAALTTVISMIIRGSTMISMPNFDPSAAWDLIREERATTSGSVPAILNFMRQVPEFAAFHSDCFRGFITGAAPMPKSVLEIFDDKGIQVIQAYGLTETGGAGTFLMPEHALDRLGSAGAANMFTELRVCDQDGNISSHGTGEVVIRGPSVMKEYWHRPDATEEAFTDGWFRTGDIAEIDAEGFVYIKDRIKDMIISGGENIYPAEVESVILSHPAVREVAVIGLADDKWGEVPCAIVAGDETQTSEDDIIAFCGDKLSRFKLPKKVIFIEVIPRNPAGKVLKRVLREQYT
ncbi:MAG: long-chain fatty acid--CoA ligase [Pseudomonadota bacterium]